MIDRQASSVLWQNKNCDDLEHNVGMLDADNENAEEVMGSSHCIGMPTVSLSQQMPLRSLGIRNKTSESFPQIDDKTVKY